PVGSGGGKEKKPAVHRTLRLGSWNIEHLGDPQARRASGAGFLQKPEDLARYIRHARLDMLAVQEVSADGPTPDGFPKQFRTNSVLTKTLADMSKAGGGTWKHILFPKMRAGDTGQWTGVAWNAKKVSPAGDVQPFDRVFVPGNQPEFRTSWLEVLSEYQKHERLSFAEFRKRLSDHYIVVTEIHVMDDDD